MNTKRILVPFDFSESSESALCEVLDMVRHSPAELTLLHVIQPHPPSNKSATPAAAPIPESATVESPEKDLGLLADTIAPRVQAGTVVKEGVPWNCIVNYAAENGTDLIVMGTHGRSKVEGAGIGSVAERVVRHAPCAVLVVRGHPRLLLP